MCEHLTSLGHSDVFLLFLVFLTSLARIFIDPVKYFPVPNERVLGF